MPCPVVTKIVQPRHGVRNGRKVDQESQSVAIQHTRIFLSDQDGTVVDPREALLNRDMANAQDVVFGGGLWENPFLRCGTTLFRIQRGKWTNA